MTILEVREIETSIAISNYEPVRTSVYEVTSDSDTEDGLDVWAAVNGRIASPSFDYAKAWEWGRPNNDGAATIFDQNSIQTSASAGLKNQEVSRFIWRVKLTHLTSRTRRQEQNSPHLDATPDRNP